MPLFTRIQKDFANNWVELYHFKCTEYSPNTIEMFVASQISFFVLFVTIALLLCTGDSTDAGKRYILFPKKFLLSIRLIGQKIYILEHLPCNKSEKGCDRLNEFALKMRKNKIKWLTHSEQICARENGRIYSCQNNCSDKFQTTKGSCTGGKKCCLLKSIIRIVSSVS